MNSFDHSIITFFNKFAQHSFTFDSLAGLIAGNTLIKGGILIIIIWWAWFISGNGQLKNRVQIIASLISCLIALPLARFLAVALPFRLRPIHEEGLQFLLPFDMERTHLDGWSSMPSDHAVFFFAIATGIFFFQDW